MGIKNINLATVEKTGVSRKLAEKIAQEAKNIQPEVKEMLKNINEIPSGTIRANFLIESVKKPKSTISKV